LRSKRRRDYYEYNHNKSLVSVEYIDFCLKNPSVKIKILTAPFTREPLDCEINISHR